MKRQVYNDLIAWKNLPASRRKPLILEGARQTGKTWLARELGRREFETFVEINFEQMTELRPLFETNFDLTRILMTIQAVTGKKVNAGTTLLFFDEIQFARRGLLSLKYFLDQMPELHIIAAGSLLGLIDHQDDSFPVGKVSFQRIYPLCFSEFLDAIGREGLAEMLINHFYVFRNNLHLKMVILLQLILLQQHSPTFCANIILLEECPKP